MELWAMDERELHYFAQELLWKYKNDYGGSRSQEWLDLIRFMIENQSWRDTVDFISTKPLGHFLKLHSDMQYELCKEWQDTGDMWLQRATLLFQLKYKSDMDTELLEKNILWLKDTKEFFLNKAIGWMLREHSKTDARWVRDFIGRTELAPLSVREGSKYI
jgi:3-methyladenine DNA glycosylase AlkD